MNDFRGKHLPRIGITVGASDGWRDDGASYNSYAAAISSVGGDPVAAGLRGERSMGSLNGLLVPGGWDVHPSRYSRMPGDEELTDAEVLERYEIHTEEERDEAELNLIRQALAANKPLLAICRGVQSLNVVLARKLIPDIGKCVPDAITHVSDGGPGPSVSHVARLTPGSLIERVYGAPEIVVNTRHHQGMTADMVADELVVTAIAPDGVVEAVESRTSSFVVGVQWHPERRVDEFIWRPSARLFEAFVLACGGNAWS